MATTSLRSFLLDHGDATRVALLAVAAGDRAAITHLVNRRLDELDVAAVNDALADRPDAWAAALRAAHLTTVDQAHALLDHDDRTSVWAAAATRDDPTLLARVLHGHAGTAGDLAAANPACPAEALRRHALDQPDIALTRHERTDPVVAAVVNHWPTRIAARSLLADAGVSMWTATDPAVWATGPADQLHGELRDLLGADGSTVMSARPRAMMAAVADRDATLHTTLTGQIVKALLDRTAASVLWVWWEAAAPPVIDLLHHAANGHADALKAAHDRFRNIDDLQYADELGIGPGDRGQVLGAILTRSGQRPYGDATNPLPLAEAHRMVGHLLATTATVDQRHKLLRFIPTGSLGAIWETLDRTDQTRLTAELVQAGWPGPPDGDVFQTLPTALDSVDGDTARAGADAVLDWLQHWDRVPAIDRMLELGKVRTFGDLRSMVDAIGG